jgi:hypothetical protein
MDPFRNIFEIKSGKNTLGFFWVAELLFSYIFLSTNLHFVLKLNSSKTNEQIFSFI